MHELSPVFMNPPATCLPFLPYGKQAVDKDDRAAVEAVLCSDMLTSGPEIAAFEADLSAYCGARHAVVVSSGTAALHLALCAARIGPGHRVLTSANTFLASANASEYTGARSDFVDIDPETLCLGVNQLAASWQADVRAVVAVDFAGFPCVSREVADFAHARNGVLIEDACHAIGAERDGYRVGGLPWVDMTVFSFHPVKTITAGEGGAILTNNDEWAARCRQLRNHGMTAVDNSSTQGPVPASVRMTALGYNYRITDLQCALGRSQLKKLDRFVHRRRAIVAAYEQAFANGAEPRCRHTPLLSAASPVHPAWHLFVLQADFDAMGTTRAEAVSALRERGIGTQLHYYPVHLQPYYTERYGYKSGKCPVAEAYADSALSIPLYPAMTDNEVERVVAAVKEVFR